jgi:hypothetical protein
MRCQLLFAQPAEIDAPLHVIAAAAVRLHLLLSHPLRALLPPPSGYMRVSLWPAQLQRAAFGCVVAASRRLTSAPSSCARCKQRSRALILRRVLGGYVAMVKVTVRAARCDCGSAACAHLVAMFVLTRAAANACSMQGSKPRLSSSRLQGDTPPSSFSFGTALQSVLASACSPPPRVQAAAAARIADRPDIYNIADAVSSGDVELVRDHLILDPLSVHRRLYRCDTRRCMRFSKLWQHSASYLNAVIPVFVSRQETPLHLACHNGVVEVCTLLLKCKADVNATNEYSHGRRHMR